MTSGYIYFTFIYCCTFTIFSSINRVKKEQKKFTVLDSFCRAVVFHATSLCVNCRLSSDLTDFIETEDLETFRLFDLEYVKVSLHRECKSKHVLSEQLYQRELMDALARETIKLHVWREREKERERDCVNVWCMCMLRLL